MNAIPSSAGLGHAGPAVPAADGPAEAPPWVCPFCPLLCDDLRALPPAPGTADPWQLQGGACARAQAGLAVAGATPSPASLQPRVAGRAVPLAEAVQAAATVLRGARQPLFGGLGTDVAGARLLYRLAAATGAICDAASGPVLMDTLRALQDRGGYSTTLAELRSRADLVLALGQLSADSAPRLYRRPGGQPPHEVVVLGGPPLAGPAPEGDPHVRQVLPGGEVAALLAQLTVLVGGRSLPAAEPALAVLAERLRAARYAVVLIEPGRHGRQAGLLVEAANRLVSALNAQGRAAVLSLGGGDGAGTVNQVFGWLSGLGLRSRAGAAGLEHEPLAWDAQRLLHPPDGGPPAVDALLWIASFGPGMAVPAVPAGLPLVVLGHPDLALPEPDTRHAPTVFIPVATPGVGCGGHLIRTDGTVLLPLRPARADDLPTVAAVLTELLRALAPQYLPAPPAGPCASTPAMPAVSAHARSAADNAAEARHG